jgi:hypothetical protein
MVASLLWIQCRHIFNAGNRCGSPALGNQHFCNYYHTTHKPAPFEFELTHPAGLRHKSGSKPHKSNTLLKNHGGGNRPSANTPPEISPRQKLQKNIDNPIVLGENSKNPLPNAMTPLCKHPIVKVVAREDDVEFVECQSCGEVFDSVEYNDIAIEEQTPSDVED